MKLTHVSIQNFRSIKSLSFEFPESGILTLVGANNAGKSNIIRAINAVCGEDWFGRDKMEDHDYYMRDRARAMKILLAFDNGSHTELNSTEKWPSYKDKSGYFIKSPRSVKDDFPCTYLGADRTFDKHLSFYDWTLIGKIRKAFHQRAAPLQGQIRTKYDELIKIFDQVQGFSRFKDDFSRYFNEMQADTPAKLTIDFKPFTPSNFFKAMQIVAMDPAQSDDPLDLGELGEGSRNTILLALLRSYATNFRGSSELTGILAVEEPEIFLHPQARRHLYRVLRDIASAGLQVIVSTHSSSFVDTEFFDSIGQVTKEDDVDAPGRRCTELTLVSKEKLVAHCVKTGVPGKKTDAANISEFYKTTSNARLNEAFFAKFLVLVEGETEELALPEYLAGTGLDCDLQGVSIIAVNGKNQLPKYWRLFSQFRTPIAILFDNDDDRTGDKRNSNANLASCFGLTVPVLVDGVDVYKQQATVNAPTTPLFILEGDFETALRKDFSRALGAAELVTLDAWEQEARALIRPLKNQNKGQIARYLARKIRQERPDYVPGFVSALAVLIRAAITPAKKQDGPDLSDDDEIPF